MNPTKNLCSELTLGRELLKYVLVFAIQTTSKLTTTNRTTI